MPAGAGTRTAARSTRHSASTVMAGCVRASLSPPASCTSRASSASNSTSMSNAFGLVAHAGRLVFVGITTDEVRFRHPVFHRPEGTLLCSRNALSADFTRIIALIEAGTIDTRPWITHRAGFEEVIGVFPSWTQPETGVIKAVV